MHYGYEKLLKNSLNDQLGIELGIAYCNNSESMWT